MDSAYIWGVFSAIISGVFFNLGWVLQKKVINDLKQQGYDTNKMNLLLKRPLWVMGAIIILIISPIFFLIAQSLIGPALVPGLMSGGYIVLIIGSIKIIKTKLVKNHIIGIGLIVIGILFLTLSQLQVSSSEVQLTDSPFVTRTIIYSVIVLIIWQGFYQSARISQNHKAFLKSISSALPFCISDFWTFFMIITFQKMGKSTVLQNYDWIFLFLAIFFYIWANLDNLRETQTAFQYGDASLVIPLQQIPTQITPIFVYYIVFLKLSPTPLSLIFVLGGVVLLIISGFILNRKD